MIYLLIYDGQRWIVPGPVFGIGRDDWVEAQAAQQRTPGSILAYLP